MNIASSTEARSELLSWLNDQLPESVPPIRRVEECGRGVPYVVLLPYLIPSESSRLASSSRVKTQAAHDFEAASNFMVLQDVLQKHNISRPPALEDHNKLIKGNFQANLSLLQWFKGFADAVKQRRERQEEVIIAAESAKSMTLPNTGEGGKRVSSGHSHPPELSSYPSSSFVSPNASRLTVVAAPSLPKTAAAGNERAPNSKPSSHILPHRTRQPMSPLMVPSRTHGSAGEPNSAHMASPAPPVIATPISQKTTGSATAPAGSTKKCSHKKDSAKLVSSDASLRDASAFSPQKGKKKKGEPTRDVEEGREGKSGGGGGTTEKMTSSGVSHAGLCASSLTSPLPSSSFHIGSVGGLTSSTMESERGEGAGRGGGSGSGIGISKIKSQRGSGGTTKGTSTVAGERNTGGMRDGDASGPLSHSAVDDGNTLRSRGSGPPAPAFHRKIPGRRQSGGKEISSRQELNVVVSSTVAGEGSLSLSSMSMPSTIPFTVTGRGVGKRLPRGEETADPNSSATSLGLLHAGKKSKAAWSQKRQSAHTEEGSGLTSASTSFCLPSTEEPAGGPSSTTAPAKPTTVRGAATTTKSDREGKPPHTTSPLATRGVTTPAGAATSAAAAKESHFSIPSLLLSQSPSLPSFPAPASASLASLSLSAGEGEGNRVGTAGKRAHTTTTVRGGGSRPVPPRIVPTTTTHGTAKEYPIAVQEDSQSFPRYSDPHAGIPVSAVMEERAPPLTAPVSHPFRAASLATTPRTPRTPRQPPRRVVPSSSVAHEKTEGNASPTSLAIPHVGTRAFAPPFRESKGRVAPPSHSNAYADGTAGEGIDLSRQRRAVSGKYAPEEEHENEEDDDLLVVEEEEGGLSPMPRPVQDAFMRGRREHTVERLGGVGQLHRPVRGPAGNVPNEGSLFPMDVGAASQPFPLSTTTVHEKRMTDGDDHRAEVRKQQHSTPRTKSVPTSSRLMHSFSQPRRGGKHTLAGAGHAMTTPRFHGEGSRPIPTTPSVPTGSAPLCIPSLDFSDEEAIEEVLELATRERQFYYDKLRMIERLVVNTAAKDLRGVDVASVALARSIRDVLYATN